MRSYSFTRWRSNLNAAFGDTHVHQALVQQMNGECRSDVAHHILVRIHRKRARLVVHNVKIGFSLEKTPGRLAWVSNSRPAPMEFVSCPSLSNSDQKFPYSAIASR